MPESSSNPLSGTPSLPPRGVALTYDDGPGPRSAELARYLYAEGVPATFFVLGESLEHYRDVLDVYRECGHTIALHSEYHRVFDSRELAYDQLARCRDRIPEYLDENVWYRPPYGTWDEPLDGYAGPVGWAAHGRDWEITYRSGQTVETCVEEIVTDLTASDGGIALLHDYAPRTEYTGFGLAEEDLDLRVVDITTLLIRRLREEGFALVALPAPSPMMSIVD